MVARLPGDRETMDNTPPQSGGRGTIPPVPIAVIGILLLIAVILAIAFILAAQLVQTP